MADIQIVLKLIGAVDWSWGVVFVPLWLACIWTIGAMLFAGWLD